MDSILKCYIDIPFDCGSVHIRLIGVRIHVISVIVIKPMVWALSLVLFVPFPSFMKRFIRFLLEVGDSMPQSRSFGLGVEVAQEC